jgi:hypothetical protein
MVSFDKKLLLLTSLFLLGYSGYARKMGTCQQRRIPVSVWGQQNNLQPPSFQAKLHGQPVKIIAERPGTESPRVVLLVDISGSVNRINHNLEMVRFVAGNFVASSGVSHVALVLFSDHIIDSLDFERSPDEIRQRLTNLQNGSGRTALFDSLMYSGSLFQAPKPGDAVYAISDGGNNYGKFNEKDVEREFLSKRIRFFFFVLSNQLFPRMMEGERLAYSDLLHLAEATGGSAVQADYDPSAKGLDRLKSSLQLAYEAMRNFYELDIELPGNFEERQHLELRIVDEHGNKRGDVKVTCARQLVTCTVDPPGTQ